jgi:predicted transcriptional regulator
MEQREGKKFETVGEKVDKLAGDLEDICKEGSEDVSKDCKEIRAILRRLFEF